MKYITIAIILTLLSANNLQSQKTITEMDAKIESIISQMTLEEKVAMCHAQSRFSSPGVPRLGVPELWMSDGPHGIRAEISWDSWAYAGWTNDAITAFPALTCLAATFNPQIAGEYGKALGEEARYRKKDVLLGPGLNIYRTPLNGRNFEYLGEDPLLTSKISVPYIKGIQENGVAACVKHFALNNQELYRNDINVEVSDRALYEIYLPAFRAAIVEGGAWAIMGSYNKFRGQYCCHNELLLNKILKEEWKFDGVVISDWGGARNTREAALNGLDIEMGAQSDALPVPVRYAYDNYYLANPFLDLLRKGEVDESLVNEKVRRILRLMMRTSMNTGRPFGRINNAEHLDVARRVAGEGIVLLKNENNFFPIDPERQITIAVIGENATRAMTVGGGSSELKAKNEVSPLEGLKKRFSNAKIIYSMGYASGPAAYGMVTKPKLDNDSLQAAAVKIASEADIVLFIGGLNKNHLQDCEGGDRQSLALPFRQDELISKIIKVNKNIGVILVSGNAIEMPWLAQVKGLMQAWYLGSEAGNAIADVVSGDINPSGKLPFSFPVKLSDNAAHYFGESSYPGDGKNQYYKEDILVGYRWHDTKKIKPLFAFGYGMSYSSFSVTDIKADRQTYSKDEKISIQCTVNNRGTREGAEVVQVYIGKVSSNVPRAEKELKAFKKVNIEEGKSAVVNLSVDINALSFYDETIGGWNLEKGEYIVYVGNASDHIYQKITIQIN